MKEKNNLTFSQHSSEPKDVSFGVDFLLCPRKQRGLQRTENDTQAKYLD